MAEASSRILIDRSTIRLDGRPFLGFGPRVLVTSPSHYGDALEDIARRGFTVVGSPPASPGTVPLLDLFMGAALKAGLMVVLITDPRLQEHGRYLAESFRHHPALLGYHLSPRYDANSIVHYLAERDAIRALDLFHPIWTPLPPSLWDQRWLGNQDLYSPVVPVPQLGGGRIGAQDPGKSLTELQAALGRSPARPTFVTDLLASTSDQERALGLYEDDPAVTAHSPNALDWYPYLTNLDTQSRRDLLGPTPEMLRLQVYSALLGGARGLLLHHYETMQGAPPCTGRDRLLEASILAQELALFSDFLAEGRPADVEIDSGHPRLESMAIQHGNEILVLLRHQGYEEDFFVDEAFMERTEISVMLRGSNAVNAWRLDFPRPKRLEIIRDQVGSIRFLGGEMELTAAILITPGQQRVEDLSSFMENRLERVARWVVEQAEVRHEKVRAVEGELAALGVGIENRERLKGVVARLNEAQSAIRMESWDDAYRAGRSAGRHIRRIIKYQMARALAMPIVDRRGIRPLLRTNYYTLPRFYRENAMETARAFSDIT